MSESENATKVPVAVVVAALESKPDGALHIVHNTEKPKPKARKRPVEGAERPVDVVSRALCGARGELSANRTTYAPESLLHPDNDDFDPTTSPICLACLEAHRGAVVPEAAPPEVTAADDRTPAEQRQAMQEAVRFLYDIQKQRIQSGNRAGPQADHAQAKLDAKQRHFMAHAATRLELLELDALKEVKRLLADHPIYDHWLSKQKGCGPLMSAVIIAYVDITKVEMASQLAAWCGLAVRSGPCSACKGVGRVGDHNDAVACRVCGGSGQMLEADRRRKGEKTRYNPWLKSKMLAVLGSSFIKANSPWRKFYDDYKNRKKNEIVKVCMLCNGTGKFKRKAPAKPATTAPEGSAAALEGAEFGTDDVVERKDGLCPLCEGRGGGVPWGRSDKHRHLAAIRYMVKMFLQQLYVEWRTLEGLSVRKPYAEEYLGRTHHTS